MCVRLTALCFLDLVVDTDPSLFILKRYRAAKLISAATGIFSRAADHRLWVKARSLCLFCGLAVAPSLSVTSVRYHRRSLYYTLGGTRMG